MEFWKLLAAILTGAAIPLVTSLLTGNREVKAFRRQRQLELIKETKAGFVRAMMALDRTVTNKGLGSKEDQEASLRWKAELSLWAPPEVNEQFLVVGNLVDEWALNARKALPEQGDGFVTMTPVKLEAHRAKATEIWPKLETEKNELEKVMKAHVQYLEDSLK